MSHWKFKNKVCIAKWQKKVSSEISTYYCMNMLILFRIKTSKSFIRQWLIWNLCIGTHMRVQKLVFELLKLFSLGNLSLLEHSSPLFVYKRWNVQRRSSGRPIMGIRWCQSNIHNWYKLATTKMKSSVGRKEYLLVAFA